MCSCVDSLRDRCGDQEAHYHINIMIPADFTHTDTNMQGDPPDPFIYNIKKGVGHLTLLALPAGKGKAGSARSSRTSYRQRRTATTVELLTAQTPTSGHTRVAANPDVPAARTPAWNAINASMARHCFRIPGTISIDSLLVSQTICY